MYIFGWYGGAEVRMAASQKEGTWGQGIFCTEFAYSSCGAGSLQQSECVWRICKCCLYRQKKKKFSDWISYFVVMSGLANINLMMW